MDPILQGIKDDIQADINSKHNPAANPLLVRAGDEASILNDIVDYADGLKTEITANATETANNTEAIEANSTAIGILQTTVSGHTTSIAANTSEIASHTDDIEANSLAIGALQTTNTARDTAQTLTDAATITWDMNLGHTAEVTLGGNRTLATPTNPARYGTLAVIQDGIGGRTLTLPAGSKVVNGGSGVMTLTAAPGAVDILTFMRRGTTYYWNKGPNYN